MRFFAQIPENYLSDMLRIERVSNPYVWSEQSIESGYQQFSHLGVFVDNILIAFVLYRVIVDEAEIIHLVCDKTYQGQGYARELLQTLREKLKQLGVKSLFLEVRDGNYPAKKLYEGLGFETVGRRANYYGGRHDALIQRVNF